VINPDVCKFFITIPGNRFFSWNIHHNSLLNFRIILFKTIPIPTYDKEDHHPSILLMKKIHIA
jgi:hypothetical protein